MTDFDELGREANERGRRDAAREIEEYERSKRLGEPAKGIWRNNPHQNNLATDERERWDDGFDDELHDHYGSEEPPTYSGADAA